MGFKKEKINLKVMFFKATVMLLVFAVFGSTTNIYSEISLFSYRAFNIKNRFFTMAVNGGTLSVSQMATPSNVNLTNEGTLDWAHWGLNSASTFNHKNGTAQQISNYTPIGTITPLRYTNNPNAYSWSNGTPTSTVSNTKTGVYLYGIGNGFQLTVPADTMQKTLKLYVGLWKANGRLEVTTSDGSASPYMDTSLINTTGTSNAVYVINYQAASSGQTLTIKWTAENTFHSVGNVTLQAASLSTNAPVNQPPTVNAGVDQTIIFPSLANLSGTATDDGLPNPPATLSTTWSKVSGPGIVTFGNTSSLNTTASFSIAGTYILRLTANDSALSSTDDVQITINNQGSSFGALAVSNAASPTNVNLTTEGTTDWAHWGLNSASAFNHKAGVVSQISNFIKIGSGSINNFNNNSVQYSWTDGTPVTNSNNNGSAIFIFGVNNGFEINVPADTTAQTLKLYAGVYAAQGKLEASLSDSSATTVVNTSLINQNGTTNQVFMINYQAASSGQTLTIKWTAATTFNQWGNVTLQAASLSGGGAVPVNQPPTVNAGVDQTIIFPSLANLSGTATDDGLPNPPATLSTTWSKVSGPGIVTFGNTSSLNTTASFSIAGTYILRLTANDSALSSTDDVQITVNNQGSSNGFLTVSNTSTPTNVNLTSEGTSDWTDWGFGGPSGFNRKANVTQQISNYSQIGSGSIFNYSDGTVQYSWSDGIPVSTVTNSGSGVFIFGLNKGFEINIPADTNMRTLKIYLGLYAAQGKFEAILSDSSAATVIDTSLVNQTASTNQVYIVNYQAASGGQNLKIRWTTIATYNQWGNVTLQAASLSGGGGIGGNPPPPSEFQISSSAPFAQYATHIAENASGDFVVAWQSNLQDGSGWGIFARKFNSDGTPQGNEFQVNTYTANNQFVPRSAIDANGNFVIVWESENQDGSGYGVYGRRYNASGVPLSGEFLINTYTTGTQHDPSIAMNPSGDFVVVWSSVGQDGSGEGVFGQRFNSNGVPQGSEFPVNTTTADSQMRSTVAIDANGNFVVGWESNLQDGSGKGIYGQRFGAAGVKQGSEFRVNTTTASDQFEQWTAMAPTGEFVFVWSSLGQDGSGSGVFAQRFDAAGVPQGGEFQVNSFNSSDQIYGTVAIDANKDFVIVWESTSQDGSGKGVYGQRFNAAGIPQGSEFQINTYTVNHQANPFAAKDSAGNFTVIWTSNSQDGSGDGVFGKRFDSAGVALNAP